MDKLERMLKKHEGYRDRVYLDSEGFPTVGYGHHLYIGSRINQTIADELFRIDIADAVNEFAKISYERRRNLNPTRRRVIVNMIFNMGLQRVLQFKKMWTAIEKGDFMEASKEMLDSRWAVQVGYRAIELSEIMRIGE